MMVLQVLFPFLLLVRCSASISLHGQDTPPNVETAFRHLHVNARQLFASDSPRTVGYSIFSGKSSLRLVKPSPGFADLPKNLLALALIIQQDLDAAHDVILGVHWDNIEQGEYAATHRGETNWVQEHALSDEDDIVHSLIHRLEGDLQGEGDHEGWDNAKYWVAGGPKKLHVIGNHAIHKAMAIACRRIAPSYADQLIASRRREHEIIAGGGRSRTVWVDQGSFDPITYINFCKNVEWSKELRNLQATELAFMVRLNLLRQETNHLDQDIEKLVDSLVEASC